MSALSLFSAYGVEIELMLVDARTLDVRPIADRLLEAVEGPGAGDHEEGPIAWSNELVRHVIELKTNGPAPALDGLAAAFQASVGRIEGLLAPLGARLLPGGMHPWMDPARETELWPHEYAEVYRAYDRVFDCRRHGWANVQSVHLNLPFADDDEFGRLMAAARIALPLVPALAAASPVERGAPSGRLDGRLEHYKKNAERVPSMAGEVIPEPIFTEEAYRARVLAPIQEALARFPEGEVFGGREWINARGAIARFDRGAIELRLQDQQECPAADLATVAAVAALVRALVEERWSDGAAQRALPSAPLVALLAATGERGPAAPVSDPALLALLGRRAPLAAGALWRALLDELPPPPAELGPPLETILARGPLATRLLAALGPRPARERLHAVYAELADCLAAGRLFHGQAPRARP